MIFFFRCGEVHRSSGQSLKKRALLCKPLDCGIRNRAAVQRPVTLHQETETSSFNSRHEIVFGKKHLRVDSGEIPRPHGFLQFFSICLHCVKKRNVGVRFNNRNALGHALLIGGEVVVDLFDQRSSSLSSFSPWLLIRFLETCGMPLDFVDDPSAQHTAPSILCGFESLLQCCPRSTHRVRMLPRNVGEQRIVLEVPQVRRRLGESRDRQGQASSPTACRPLSITPLRPKVST